MKIQCINPDHKDNTPSLHVYENGAWCFVCGFKCSIKELPEYVKSEIKATPKEKEKEKENIEEKIKYIRGLKKIKIRGLTLHSDESGYYILWPDSSYYKLRRWDDKPRYVAPKGQKPTLFRVNDQKRSKTLVIVEGEINALSLELAINCSTDNTSVWNELCIVSPGPASGIMVFKDYYLQFKKILVIIDKDAAGVYYGVQLKDELLKNHKNVSVSAVTKDFNQVLCENGPEELRQVFDKLRS